MLNLRRRERAIRRVAGELWVSEWMTSLVGLWRLHLTCSSGLQFQKWFSLFIKVPLMSPLHISWRQYSFLEFICDLSQQDDLLRISPSWDKWAIWLYGVLVFFVTWDKSWGCFQCWWVKLVCPCWPNLSEDDYLLLKWCPSLRPSAFERLLPKLCGR